jgi:excisionase family DNA binding protein
VQHRYTLADFLGNGYPSDTSKGQQMTELSERWITLKEAAAHLNVSPSWLYQKGQRAGVPRARIGSKYRYQVSQLNDWMNSQAGRVE